MRHAFLIIAHNEFEVLQRLISQLDSEESDIFVHIDKKVKDLPNLVSKHSNLNLLPHRIDARWGDISLIKTELYLLKYAEDFGQENKRHYDYFHIISGVHLLLKSISGFDKFFQHNPYAVLSPFNFTEYEVNFKIRRYNLFTKPYSSPNSIIRRFSQIAWRLTNLFQQKLGIRHLVSDSFYKASEWCSLSSSAASYIVDRSKIILNKYKWAFCADEFFIPSELMNSSHSGEIDWNDKYIYVDFGDNTSPKVITSSDFDKVMSSQCLCARKFSQKNIDVVNKIIEMTSKTV